MAILSFDYIQAVRLLFSSCYVYLDVGENALVAFYLALELSELLDVREGDVLPLNLDACSCESLCNLG